MASHHFSRAGVGRSQPPGLLAFAFSLLPVCLLAQETSPTREPHGIGRASSPIVVDGLLDEAAWQSATRLPLPFETRPAENVPAAVETAVMLTYDTDALFVAFHAQDPDPSAIVARLADRDRAFSDDFVGIVLDTFNDETRAFEFFVNPLGVQMDLFNDDSRGEEDESWDAIWSSAGRITDGGYNVEMRIPWSSLRFPAGGERQIWGIDALRYYPRRQRHRFGLHKIDRNRPCYGCQMTKIAGFEGITPGRNLEITPTVTASRTDLRQDFPDGGFESGSTDSEAGLSARWGITPNIALNATVNPDFSQVEADSARLNVNEQFALFFPEKRPFFLEGADLFSTRLNAVFTRNVADPRWGLKLSGKEGKHALGFFVARDERTNLLIPGSESSSASSIDDESTDAALRYRRDLPNNSNIGALFTNRSSEDYQNQVAGFDGLYRPTSVDRISFQVLGSRTEYTPGIVEQFGQPAGRFEGLAASIGYERRSRDWHAYARYEDIGEDFRADLGFMPQVGYRLGLLGLRRTWYGKEGDFFNQISFGGDWNRTENRDGRVLEDESEIWVEGNGPRESFFVTGAGLRKRGVAGREFNENFIFFFGEVRPIRDLYINLDISGGDQVDFANVRLGERFRVEPQLRIDAGRRLRLNLKHDYFQLDVEGGNLFTANLSELSAVYQINLRSFVRALFQYAHIERSPELYTFEVEELSESLFTQVLFSYKLNPQTVLFAGYSDTALGDQQIDLTRKDRTLFLKIGYAWVL